MTEESAPYSATDNGPQTAYGRAPGEGLALGVDFGLALNLLRKGLRMQRRGWNGKGMYVYLVAGSVFPVTRAPLLFWHTENSHLQYRPHIDMRTAQGDFVPWVASQSDLLAEDWVVYREEASQEG